jgi:hypothetical protein
VLSGEHSAHVCTRLSSSEAGPDTGGGVLERWGHSSVQCNSSCKAPGECGTRDTLCMIWELWA